MTFTILKITTNAFYLGCEKTSNKIQDGNIGEILVYTVDMSEDAIMNMYSYLQNKWHLS